MFTEHPSTDQADVLVSASLQSMVNMENLHMCYLYLFCPTSAVAIELVAGGHGADSAGDLPAGPRPPEAAG